MNKKIKLSILGTLILTSTLAFTLPIVSCSSSTSNDVELSITNEVKKAVENAITNSLTNKMGEAITKEEKQALADSWKVGDEIPEYAKNSIKDLLIFKGGNEEFKYDDAVKNVYFETKTQITVDGLIKGPKLRINFKNGYTGDVTIQTGIIGNISNDYLYMDASVLNNVTYAVTKILKIEMDKADSYKAQVAQAAKWSVGSEIPEYVLSSIKNILKFKDSNNKEFGYDEVVKSINFTKSAIIGELGEEIIGPELKVNFKDGYDGTVIIQVGNLGTVAGIGITLVDDGGLDETAKDLNNLFTSRMSAQSKYEEQIEIGMQWSTGSALGQSFTNQIRKKLNFVDDDGLIFNGTDVVKSITFASETFVPPNGEFIIGPKLKVNLNDQYSSKQDIIINSGLIGNAINYGPVNLSINFLEVLIFKEALRSTYQNILDGFQNGDEQKQWIEEINNNTGINGYPMEESIFWQVIPHLKLTDNFKREILGIYAIEGIVIEGDFLYTEELEPITFDGKFVVSLKNGYNFTYNFFDNIGIITTLKP